MNIRKRFSSFVLLTAAAAFSWQVGAKAQTMVVVGDSLSAGYLNGSLHEAQQPRGYASVVAAQAAIDLPLPLIAAPGIPAVLILDPDTGEITQDLGASTGRVHPLEQAYNLSVPGATAYHALALEPDFTASPATRVQAFTNLVLGLPGVYDEELNSQVAWADELDPDIVLLWVGGQDALLGLINGTDAAATDPDRFAIHFSGIMDALTGTGADIFVANVPSVTNIPFLLSRLEAAMFLGVGEIVLEAFLNIAATDSVTLDALGPLAAALVSGNPALFDRDPTTCFVIEAENVADLTETCDDFILDEDEILAIENKVAAYNAVIDNVVADTDGGATLVDIRGFFNDVAPFIAVNGPPLTVDYLGGIFSLDGIHPTFTAQALIADEFIAAIDAAHGYEAVPRLTHQQLRAVRDSDPLAFLFPAMPPPGFGPVFELGRGNTVSGVLGPRALEPRKH